MKHLQEILALLSIAAFFAAVLIYIMDKSL
jgi:hypothetical protein